MRAGIRVSGAGQLKLPAAGEKECKGVVIPVHIPVIGIQAVTHALIVCPAPLGGVGGSVIYEGRIGLYVIYYLFGEEHVELDRELIHGQNTELLRNSVIAAVRAAPADGVSVALSAGIGDRAIGCDADLAFIRAHSARD